MGKAGLFSDYVQARMECSGGGFDRSMDKANADPATKKQVVINKNLIWSILQSKSFLSTDTELAEMVMSLTGTLIIDKQEVVTNVSSLAGSPDLINALIGGSHSSGRAKIWRCTDAGSTNQCMKVQLKEITIPEHKSLTYRVHQIIQSINEKLKQDEKPSPQEINFLSLTSIPVMKFLTVLNSTQYGKASVDMDDYAMLIAQDLLQNYFSELLQEIANATAGSELNEDLVKAIENRIKKANQTIASLVPKVGRKLQEKLTLIEHVARIEKQVASNLVD